MFSFFIHIVNRRLIECIIDGRADPCGRFFGGTMRNEICSDSSAPSASFYRYIGGIGLTQLFSNVKVSNGIVWNTKTCKMYYADSCRQAIFEFDWDRKTGDICNEFDLNLLSIHAKILFNSYQNWFYSLQAILALHSNSIKHLLNRKLSFQMVWQLTMKDLSIVLLMVDQQFIKLIQCKYKWKKKIYFFMKKTNWWLVSQISENRINNRHSHFFGDCCGILWPESRYSVCDKRIATNRHFYR